MDGKGKNKRIGDDSNMKKTMKKEMKRVWLVQRGKFNDIPSEKISGIDSLIRFDYMGAAEFEFGALGKSLKRMVADIETYEFAVVSVKDSLGNSMMVYRPKEFADDVEINSLYLAEGELRLKEYCDIPIYIAGEKIYSLVRNNFWWDIENDFMICFGEENQEKLKVAMDKMKEKWS